MRRNLLQSPFQSFVNFLSVAYLVCIVILALSPFWPKPIWWLAGLLQIVPSWIFGLPLAILIPLHLMYRDLKHLAINAAGLLIFIFGTMGYVFFQGEFATPSAMSVRVRVVTINTGQLLHLEKMMEYINAVHPDIVAFQEMNYQTEALYRQAFPENTWYFHTSGQVGLASRYKIIDAQAKDREHGWRIVTTRYTLEGPQGRIILFNVHLDTLRRALEPLVHRDLRGLSYIREVTASQEEDAVIVSNWAMPDQNVIVTGDFNMRESNPIYRTYFSKFNNAFSQGGSGLGWTKFTNLLGVRIDHVLFDNNFRAAHTMVGPDVGSDHRPVLAELVIRGQPTAAAALPTVPIENAAPPEKNFWIYENFESSVGRFTYNTDVDVKIDRDSTFGKGSVLRVANKPLLNFINLGYKFENWNFENYPMLRFAYRLPPGTPLLMRVQTEFGDWLCLAGTSTGQCSDAKAKDFITLTDDNQWHEISLNIQELVQSLLAKLRVVEEFEFTIPEARPSGEVFWIDEFRIFKP